MTTRHCCHLPGTLAMTRRTVSCVTFAIYSRIAFLMAVNVGEGVSKNLSFQISPQKNINSPKNAIRQQIANVTQDTVRRVMAKCTWELAAMPLLSWRTSPRRCIEDVRLFVNPRQ